MASRKPVSAPLTPTDQRPPDGWLKSFWTPFLIAIIGAALAAGGNVYVTQLAGENAVSLERAKDGIAIAAEKRKDTTAAIAAFTDAVALVGHHQAAFLFEVVHARGNPDSAFRIYSPATRELMAKAVSSHMTLARMDPILYTRSGRLISDVVAVDTAIVNAPSAYKASVSEAHVRYESLWGRFTVTRSLFGRRVANMSQGPDPDVGMTKAQIPHYEDFLQANPMIDMPK